MPSVYMKTCFFPRGSTVLLKPRSPYVDAVRKPCFSTLVRTAWTGGEPVARLLPTQTNTNIDALSGILTLDPSIQAAETDAFDHAATVIIV